MWQQRLFIGTHGGSVYCLSLEGAIQWQVDVGDVVYGTPCVVDDAVCVAARRGALLLLAVGSGERMAAAQLQGEVFSTPVAWGQELRVAVGSRDNHVYCYRLHGESPCAVAGCHATRDVPALGQQLVGGLSSLDLARTPEALGGSHLRRP